MTTEMTTTYEEAAAAAEYYQRKADDLIETYGRGVRPAWVSAEHALADDLAKRWRARAKELRQ